MKGPVPKQPPWQLTAEEIASVVGGTLVSGEQDERFGPVSIDTRTLAAGDLFFAIRGDRFDGHDFVSGALDCGARGVVVSDRRAVPTSATAVVIIVQDTVGALQALAQHVRSGSGARVIAITGSTGKTSTKEIVAVMLQTRYRVVRNQGNRNNHIGLPLSLLALLARPELAVVELGMNHVGEIARLVAIAKPDVRVWTNVGDAHVGLLGSVERVADAKAEIMEGATPDSLLIANADDAYVMSRAHQFPGQVVTFGIHAPADVKAGDVRDRGLSGIEATITTSEASLPLRVPLLGLGQFANVLAAVTVALQFQIPLHTIAAEASALKPFVHRGEVFRLRNDIVVVDDSYNSSPSALTVALEILNTEKADGRRVAVLGEMRELGSRGRELHRHSGLMAAKCGLDLLVSVGGPDAIALADGAVDGGLNPEQVHHVTTSDEAGPLTASLLQTSDLVVVKGSRGVQTDLVVEYLKSELA